MNLGVDLGTTHAVVAIVDRGNYPVLTFFDDDGDPHEGLPSVVAEAGGELVHGFDAVAAAAAGAPALRSFKRLLAAPDVSATTPVRVGDVEIGVLDLLTGFVRALREALLTRSNLEPEEDEELRAVVAVPAHAHSAQRFLTLEAFRRAGFEVVAMLNEPSAAGFEYTHRLGRRTVSSRRTRVVVYDLGGGTFDASLVDVAGTAHEVLGTVGLNRLGGDDFDEVLARCALEAAGVENLPPAARDALLQECREAKERLSAQSRRIPLDVAGVSVDVPVATFYAAAARLVEESVAAMAPLLGDADDRLADVAGIYLVGGGSGLPLVPRALRERFGRRVHRSPHPSASTAIGLAVAADEDAGYALTDRLSRGFGVFRERSAGTAVSFDPLLPPQTAVSAQDDVVVTRTYRAAHNLGWFRFAEYSSADAAGEPRGELVPFADVLFPFDPSLREGRDLRQTEVRREGPGCLVEERYVVDRHGIVSLDITDLDTGYRVSRTISAPAG